MGAGKHGDEVPFECLNSPLGFVGSLVERGNQLIGNQGRGEGSEERCWCLIVQYLEFGMMTVGLEPSMCGCVCGNELIDGAAKQRFDVDVRVYRLNKTETKRYWDPSTDEMGKRPGKSEKMVSCRKSEE